MSIKNYQNVLRVTNVLPIQFTLMIFSMRYKYFFTFYTLVRVMNSLFDGKIEQQ